MLPSNIVYNENGFRIEVIFKEGETPNGLFYVRQRESCLLFQRRRRRKTSEGWNKMTDGIHFPGQHSLKLAQNATANVCTSGFGGETHIILGFAAR